MAISDPFSTTYAGSYKAGTSLGKGIQKIADMIAEQSKLQKEYELKGKLAEREEEVKSKFRSPLTALKESLEVEKLQKEISGELPEKEEVGRATVLRKEFNTDQAYKNFQVLQRSADQMKEAYNLAVSPKTESKVAADQALAVTFQKMLDPASVVRESEYARTPEGVALLNRMSTFVEQLQRGGLRIADTDRLALIQAANKMLKSGKKQLNQHIRRYKSLAKDYRVRTSLVLGDVDEFDVERTYMLDGEPYEVPESQIQEFLKDNPTAQEI